MTKLWYVSRCIDNKGAIIVVHTQKQLPEKYNQVTSVRIRSITAKAAARRYVRSMLPVEAVMADDGWNDLPDALGGARRGKFITPGQAKRYRRVCLRLLRSTATADVGGVYGFRLAVIK